MKLENIETVIDSERGCGWRKPGGLYLRADGPTASCGKLPIPLTVCPCCSAGIKPARGWSWFKPAPFFEAKKCAGNLAFKAGALSHDPCQFCPCGGAMPDRAGLLWVGEKYYKTPEAWLDETKRLGVSRRIPRVPQGFKLGDMVFMAHRKAIKDFDSIRCDCQPAHDLHTENCKGWTYTPAIFHQFTPSRIEYVCKGNETEEQLAALVERKITPVKVVKDIEQKEIGL